MSFSGPSTKKRGTAPRDQTSSPTYVLGESTGEKVVDAVTVEHVDHENWSHSILQQVQYTFWKQ